MLTRLANSSLLARFCYIRRRLFCIRRTLCCFVGWCVGCNPPFVDCGIRLIGLPAPPVDTSSATVCPFHLQDGRFNASTQHTPHYARFIAKSEWTCRFCSVAKALAFPEGCNSTRGRSFLKPFTFSGLESHTPTRQPDNLMRNGKQ